ncbi:fumarylacetoacetate hydrolase family protein [Elongatibacter sediminis]|uniref:Fumarylacetoacetate hydrolase family protein n=1 Tax=Elongatibacter sediminis TaxID=3119006 RepID=A0AAW9RAQ6_9GAMM
MNRTPDTHVMEALPEDAGTALLLARAWSPEAGGPVPLLIRDGHVLDISALAPTISQLCEGPNLAARLRAAAGRDLGPVSTVFAPPAWARNDTDAGLALLSPVDLQCIKACGVTFAVSVLERVIEEQAGGDLRAAERIRATLAERLGDRLSDVTPGSAEAADIKRHLIEEGLWSQYLEVAIGPDAEVFTKAPPLSAVGWGDWIGIREDSEWNNSEPEIVLVCNSRGKILGASLGNDMNLRDFEGRSALLLGKAKDNTASAAIGPFIRVFDEDFTLDDVRSAEVSLEVNGDEGFHFRDASSMTLMSRDPEDLVAQTCGDNHQYPDGFALYLGSLIAPTQDRDGAGKGFTHHPGDRVTVASPQLGALSNEVTWSSHAPRWEYGIGALLEHFRSR